LFSNSKVEVVLDNDLTQFVNPHFAPGSMMVVFEHPKKISIIVSSIPNDSGIEVFPLNQLYGGMLFAPDGCRTSSEPTSGAVVGNARSPIFEWPACPCYSSNSSDNQVPFSSPQPAEAAGYRPAHSCP
jgi:hypothetical protein